MDKTQQNNAQNKKQGKRIQSRIKTLGLRQKDVAKRIGASDATVSGWVNGKTSPNKKYLEKLAEQLNVTTDWVLNGGYVSKKKIPGKVSSSAPYTKLSTLLKDRITELKLRQLDIISQVDASRATVSNWFNGKALPSNPNMDSLATVLEVSVKDLNDAARADEAEAINKQVEAESDDNPSIAMDLSHEDDSDDESFDLEPFSKLDDDVEEFLEREAAAKRFMENEPSGDDSESVDSKTDFVKELSDDAVTPNLHGKLEDIYNIQGGNMGADFHGETASDFDSPESEADRNEQSSSTSSKSNNKQEAEPNSDQDSKCITEETTITFTINIVTKKYQS